MHLKVQPEKNVIKSPVIDIYTLLQIFEIKQNGQLKNTIKNIVLFVIFRNIQLVQSGSIK